MSKMPAMFGAPEGSKPSGQGGSNKRRTRRGSDVETASKRPRQDTHASQAVTGASAPASEVSAPSSIYHLFGKMGEAAVPASEYKKWLAKSEEERDRVGARASVELLLFHADKRARAEKSTQRIKELDDEVSQLRKEAKVLSARVAKGEQDRKARESKLKADLARLEEEKDQHIQKLEEKVSSLTQEVEDLQDESMPDLSSVKAAAFEEGVKAYCKLFLAGDPEYNWRAKFDSEVAGFIETLAEEEKEAIEAKRAEMQAALARQAPPTEGIVNPSEVAVSQAPPVLPDPPTAQSSEPVITSK